MAIPQFMPWTDKIVGRDAEGNDIHEHLDYPIYRGDVGNLIYPLGFQPFMRCHMQNGYGIYMRAAQSLQSDFELEKLRFRHNEELSQRVFELMKGGELIYPHEGLIAAEFIIDKIKCATRFSHEAFGEALYRSHFFRLADSEQVQRELGQFFVNGNPIKIEDSHPWKLSSGRRKGIDEDYQNFSLEDWYGIRILERRKIPAPSAMFEPWMQPEEDMGDGIKDFKVRDKVNCGSSIVERDFFNLLSMIKMKQIPDF